MTNQNSHIYKVGKVPRNLWKRGESLEPRFGVLAKEYKTICFDREILKKDTTLEWVTPGHPLFETIREESLEAFARELKKGAVFYDLYRNEPSRLNVFTASIVDGSGQLLHKRIFVIETAMDNSLTLRQPTIFLDINAIEGQTEVPAQNLPGVPELESFLVNNALNEYKVTVEQERHRELHTIEKHLELSLTALIHKQNVRLGQLIEMRESGKIFQGIEGQMSQVEQRILELNNRLDDRRNKLTKERQIAITDVKHLGSAWVLPHPERNKPEIKAMRSDSEIEHIAVDAVIAHEEAQGRKVQSVEKDNRGFDLISRAFHPEDPETAINVRFIEVKGRSEVGEVALSDNEYKTAHRLGNDYFLYVVYNCASKCDIHIIQDPARLGWKPIVRIEHYHISSGEVIKNSTGTGGQIQ